MDQIADSSVLEYGGLGLAFIVIVVVLWMQWRRDEGQKEERLAHLKTQEETATFVRSMALSALESQDRHADAFREMTSEVLNTYSKVGLAIDELSKETASTCEAIRDGNKKLGGEIQNLYTVLTQVERQINDIGERSTKDHGRILGMIEKR